MDKDYLKEQINYYIEMLKIFWAILVVLTGGIFTIVLNLHLVLNFENIVKFGVIVLGVFFDCVVIMMIKDFNKQIFGLLVKLEKQQ